MILSVIIPSFNERRTRRARIYEVGISYFGRALYVIPKYNLFRRETYVLSSRAA
jgi:hypothetical protein